jgi:hypothetical protein
MADAVTSQILLDGPNNVVMKFTNVSDGTGEAAVTKVDVSALGGAPDEVRIDKIDYHTNGMGVNILWDATADVLAYAIGPNGDGCANFKDVGGIRNNAGDGKTGDIQFTTVGDDSGDVYAITLHMRKHWTP